MSRQLPSIDVVIPMSGSWRLPYLRNCLRSLEQQDYPSELIGVTIVHTTRYDGDNGVQELAELCREKGATLVFIHQDDPAFNISKAYNAGVRAGSRDALALLDCDVFFHRRTFLFAADALLEGRGGAIIPVVRSRHGPASEMFERLVYEANTDEAWEALSEAKGWQRDADGNAIFPRHLYEQLQGYDERYHGWGCADNDIVARFRHAYGTVDLIDLGCPKSYHQSHKQRPSCESEFTKRNRDIIATSRGNVRNHGTWGRIPVVRVLENLEITRGELVPDHKQFPRFNRTFGGVDAQHAASTYTEIDMILAAGSIKRIIELGSARGALSMYLGLCGRRLGIPVYTVDFEPVMADATRRVLADLGVTVLRLNCLGEGPGRLAVRALVSDVPVYLLCDNGNKQVEFSLYAQHLMPGSMVSVHDWLSEVGPQGVDGIVQKLQLQPFREQAWTQENLRMATWSVPNRGQVQVSGRSDSTTWRKGTEDIWHQETVGGQWNAMGKAQLAILKQHGLTPESNLLDVGCGALRLGVHAIDYLEPQHYFGIDCFEELLKVGLKREINPRGLDAKNPSFVVNADFDMHDFGSATFDMAIAQSVFTHLAPQDIELCVRNVMQRIRPNGVFLASYNESDNGWCLFGEAYPKMTRYSFEVFESIARRVGVRIENIGVWGIPQNARREQLLLALRH
jgi:SAM-dependent methyltransferase/glycosyltransferase involved in cell wall biosynthesis